MLSANKNSETCYVGVLSRRGFPTLDAAIDRERELATVAHTMLGRSLTPHEYARGYDQNVPRIATNRGQWPEGLLVAHECAPDDPCNVVPAVAPEDFPDTMTTDSPEYVARMERIEVARVICDYCPYPLPDFERIAVGVAFKYLRHGDTDNCDAVLDGISTRLRGYRQAQIDKVANELQPLALCADMIDAA